MYQNYNDISYAESPFGTLNQYMTKTFGWMFADPSFGGSAWRAGNLTRHNHYFGNLDVYRCVTVNGFQQDFEPASRFWRADPYDNQVGEVECSTRGLLPRELDYDLKVVDFQEI